MSTRTTRTHARTHARTHGCTHMLSRRPRNCQHQRIRSECKERGGASICLHQRQRSECKGAGGRASARAGADARMAQEHAHARKRTRTLIHAHMRTYTHTHLGRALSMMFSSASDIFSDTLGIHLRKGVGHLGKLQPELSAEQCMIYAYTYIRSPTHARTHSLTHARTRTS